ncbi:MAG: glucosyltransferase domain-containing protein [Spirochaetaceae bacterium]|nr:glucosyltransferase domain-containing protein [Spirochaetaceae bacterium]
MDVKALFSGVVSKLKAGESQKTGYFKEEPGIYGFLNFCRANMLLIAAITFAIFCTYGIKLWFYSIGIDTELAMAGYGAGGGPATGATMGRWGGHIPSLPGLLQSLIGLKEMNPWLGFFLGFCLFWLVAIEWCYFINIFSNKAGVNNSLIPFAVVFTTMQVWIEMFYFPGWGTQYMLFLCPIITYLLYKGFLDREYIKLGIGFIILVRLVSSYQSMLLLFAFAVFIAFILIQENSDYDNKFYGFLCLKLFICLLAALAIYLLGNIIVLKIYNTQQNGYIDRMIRWGKDPAMSNLSAIKSYFSNLMLGRSRISSFNYLLPVVVLFLIQAVYVAVKHIKPGRRVLYILAALGVPLTFCVLPIAGAYSPPLRSQYALPFALGFMLYYLVIHYKKFFSWVVFAAAVIIAMFQSQIGSQMYYSDYMRYQEDVRLAGDFARRLDLIEDPGNTIPVVFVGKIRAGNKFKRNYIEGEIVGRSFWGLQGAWTSSPIDGLSFMRTIGLNYPWPNEVHLNKALQTAAYMPSYPAEGCVVRLDDVIVFKLSDDLYGW